MVVTGVGAMAVGMVVDHALHLARGAVIGESAHGPVILEMALVTHLGGALPGAHPVPLLPSLSIRGIGCGVTGLGVNAGRHHQKKG